MARFKVIVDQVGITRRSVKTFAKIFKEDPDKHRANSYANQRQPICCGHSAGHVLRWAYVCHHLNLLRIDAASILDGKKVPAHLKRFPRGIPATAAPAAGLLGSMALISKF